MTPAQREQTSWSKDLCFSTSDAVRIAYRVDDFTDPWTIPQTIVLLHSAMSNARRLYALVPHLASKYRVVRMELRGHGDSEVPSPDRLLTLERLTRDVLELLDHLRTVKAHFLGFAGGGYLAQQVAIHYPERVLSILLFASRPGFKDSNAAGWIPGMKRKGLRAFLEETIEDRLPREHVSQAQIDWFLDEMARNDPEYVARYVLYMTTQYWMDDLAKIRCPTLIVAPGEESIGNASAYAQMQRLIPGSELLVYEGARHNIGDYLADRCAQDALDFLARNFPVGQPCGPTPSLPSPTSGFQRG
jgi:pimeloyl-ACP methyl ester carboxylesterase